LTILKNILVTGAEGFIGSHLVEKLVSKGHFVRAFCLYNSFNELGWLKVLDPSILQNIEIIMGDIRDIDSISKASTEINCIFHLAALIAIPYSYISPESYIDTNIKGTLNVLRTALDKNIDQVIHTSTSEVYGTAQFVPMTEDHPLSGQSPYSASKIGADQLAHSYYCAYGLPVSIIRPFNTYGPRQSLRAVIPTIIAQALAGKTNLNLGNVEATRDFNFVQDTVDGMIAFLENEKTFGQTINVGSGIEHTIKKVVILISKVLDVPLEITVDLQRIRPEKSEVERLCADNSRAKQLLGWYPKYSLEEGLKATCDWFKHFNAKGKTANLKYVI
jgi:NAD dependent epimerase/dehydratase